MFGVLSVVGVSLYGDTPACLALQELLRAGPQPWDVTRLAFNSAKLSLDTACTLEKRLQLEQVYKPIEHIYTPVIEGASDVFSLKFPRQLQGVLSKHIFESAKQLHAAATQVIGIGPLLSEKLYSVLERYQSDLKNKLKQVADVKAKIAGVKEFVETSPLLVNAERMFKNKTAISASYGLIEKVVNIRKNARVAIAELEKTLAILEAESAELRAIIDHLLASKPRVLGYVNNLAHDVVTLMTQKNRVGSHLIQMIQQYGKLLADRNL